MFIRLLILGLFCLFLTRIPDKFLKLDYFKLKKIDIITENSKMLDTELTKLSENLYNKNNFEIDYNELKDFIKNDIRVKDVEIEEVGLGEIQINVIEKTFSYYANIKNEIYLVDENGELFGYMTEKKKESIPLLVAKTREEVQEMVALLNIIKGKAISKYVSQIYKKTDEDYRIVLIDGVEIKINNEVEPNRYKILEVIYSEMKKNRKLEYIDLRFDDYIIKYLEDE